MTLLSKVILARTKTIFSGSNLHVMMQALKRGDGPCFPHGLSIMNNYTDMMTGSKCSCSCGEEPDCYSDHHYQEHQGHLSSSCE